MMHVCGHSCGDRAVLAAEAYTHVAPAFRASESPMLHAAQGMRAERGFKLPKLSETAEYRAHQADAGPCKGCVSLPGPQSDAS